MTIPNSLLRLHLSRSDHEALRLRPPHTPTYNPRVLLVPACRWLFQAANTLQPFPLAQVLRTLGLRADCSQLKRVTLKQQAKCTTSLKAYALQLVCNLPGQLF